MVLMSRCNRITELFSWEAARLVACNTFRCCYENLMIDYLALARSLHRLEILWQARKIPPPLSSLLHTLLVAEGLQLSLVIPHSPAQSCAAGIAVCGVHAARHGIHCRTCLAAVCVVDLRCCQRPSHPQTRLTRHCPSRCQKADSAELFKFFLRSLAGLRHHLQLPRQFALSAAVRWHSGPFLHAAEPPRGHQQRYTDVPSFQIFPRFQFSCSCGGATVVFALGVAGIAHAPDGGSQVTNNSAACSALGFVTLSCTAMTVRCMNSASTFSTQSPPIPCSQRSAICSTTASSATHASCRFVTPPQAFLFACVRLAHAALVRYVQSCENYRRDVLVLGLPILSYAW